jgi:CRP/FNR family transcriptional regulator, cyclic AMP receptor protein
VANEISLDKEDHLFNKGEDYNNMIYILQEGTLEVFDERDGKKIVVGHIQAGEAVGEMSLLDGGPRSATVIAKTKCSLLEIQAKAYTDLVESWPKWYQVLVKTLLDRLRQANSRVNV